MKNVYSTALLVLFATFTFAQGTWSPKTNFGGAARYRGVSFTVNGKCYVGTGSTGGGITQNLQDFWEYDPALNAWTQVADLAGPKRTNATGASHGDFGYVGLGSNAGVVLNDWWQYSPDSNAWYQKTNFPAHTRYGAGSFTLSGRIYVGGGIDSNNVVYADFYSYEPTTDQWISRHSLPTTVTSMATFTIGSKGYFVGGAINGSVSATTQNAEYDPVADTWNLRAPFSGGNIFSCVGFSLDDIGYVGTGFAGNLTNFMYRYEPIPDMWTQETNFPANIRQWAVCCNVNNRAFVGTGNSTGGNLYNDWWEFVPMTTGIKNSDVANSIYFDLPTHQLIVRNAKGNENVRIISTDGKLVANYKLQTGTNSYYLNESGIFLVQLTGGTKPVVLKIMNVE